MHAHTTNRTEPFERLMTIQEAAKLFGIPTWKLQRSVKAGLVPSYRILNKRRLVRICDIEAVVEASRDGGDDDQ